MRRIIAMYKSLRIGNESNVIEGLAVKEATKFAIARNGLRDIVLKGDSIEIILGLHVRESAKSENKN